MKTQATMAPIQLSYASQVISLLKTGHLTHKKSIIGQALARFFCGLLIGSNVGINAKWISTLHNKIADEVSRLKVTDPSPSNLFYDFSKLK
jgi:hypothetical protein